MRDELEEVLLLQTDFTPVAKNPSMARRGDLVVREIPQQIRSIIAGSADSAINELEVQGKDAQGSKAEVPWVRIFLKQSSPAPTRGWYLVYLFSADGDKVYLSLNQGTTTWNPSTEKFVKRPPEELASRVDWARTALETAGHHRAAPITLNARSGLGRGYELGNVDAIAYELDEIPSASVLETDLLDMSRLLNHLYAAEKNSAYLPGDTPPEISDTEVATRQAAGRARHGSGQGFQLSVAEKLVIERCAVDRATKHFESKGYRVKDVGAKESFDLLAENDHESLSVEVKGTVSPREKVILTANEVAHHRACFPANALAVVHSIALDRSGAEPVARGGELVVTSPWKIDEGALEVISYRYSTP